MSRRDENIPPSYPGTGEAGQDYSGGTGEAPTVELPRATPPIAPLVVAPQAAAPRRVVAAGAGVIAEEAIKLPVILAVKRIDPPSFHSSAHDTGRQRLHKVLLLGDTDTRKSAFLERIVGDSFISFIGFDFQFYTDGDTRYQIWDMAGQERFRTVTEAYYRGVEAALIMGGDPGMSADYERDCRERGFTCFNINYGAELSDRPTLTPFNADNLRASTIAVSGLTAAQASGLAKDLGSNLLRMASEKIDTLAPAPAPAPVPDTNSSRGPGSTSGCAVQ